VKRPLAVVFGVLAVGAGFVPFHTTGVLAQAAPPVTSLAFVEAKEFLDRYRTLNSSQSPEFYDLYSDRAVVHVMVQGQNKGVSFQGRSYRPWARDLLQRGRAGLDGSMFRDATVERRGTRLLIRAKRYSSMHCYWDTSYQLGIEKEETVYRIVEERYAINPSAHCDAANAAINGASGQTLTGIDVGGTAPAMTLPSISNPAFVGSPVGGGYHPLSQQEIAETALRMAQEIAAKNPSLVKGFLPASALASTAPGVGVPVETRPALTTAPAGPASAVWQTPED